MVGSLKPGYNRTFTDETFVRYQNNYFDPASEKIKPWGDVHVEANFDEGAGLFKNCENTFVFNEAYSIVVTGSNGALESCDFRPVSSLQVVKPALRQGIQ
mgnify:CR=1 FL=1